MTTFRTVAGVTACTSCGQVIDGTGWRPKTSHVCARSSRADRIQYAEALARLNERPRILRRSADSAKILDRFGSEFCDSAKILDRFSASLPKSYQNPTKEV